MKAPSGTKSRISIYLRFAALIASLAALIAFAYSQSLHDREAVLTTDLGQHVVTPATGTTQYAFIWSLIIIPIELSTPVALHPGIYVAFDLVAWVAVTIGVVIYLLLMEPYFTGGGYSSCGRDYPDCESYHVAEVEHFATAMAFLAVVIHFGFFVQACWAVDKHRKNQRLKMAGKSTVDDAA